MRALEGRRVIVTRARRQAARFAAALEARGAHPIFFPTIAIRPVDDHRSVDAVVRRLADFSWIVFTSANAVAQLWTRLQVANVAHLPSGLKVAAVGPATAEALAQIGIAVDAQPTLHAGTAIASMMGPLPDARVLFPHGDLARAETAHALRECGARVTEVIVYRTVLESPDPAELQQLRAGVDAITFTSPSTAHGFAAMLGGEARMLTRSAVLATIGPTTSAAVRDEGWGEPLEAPVATSESLAEVLEMHFASMVAAPGLTA